MLHRCGQSNIDAPSLWSGDAQLGATALIEDTKKPQNLGLRVFSGAFCCVTLTVSRLATNPS